MAAGLATLEVYEDLNLFEYADNLAPYWEEALHSLKGFPNVIDIRYNYYYCHHVSQKIHLCLNHMVGA